MVTIAVNPLNVSQTQNSGTASGSSGNASVGADFSQILSSQLNDNQQNLSTQSGSAVTSQGAPAKSTTSKNKPADETSPAASTATNASTESNASTASGSPAATNASTTAGSPTATDTSTVSNAPTALTDIAAPTVATTPIAAAASANAVISSASNTNQAAKPLSDNTATTTGTGKSAHSQHTSAGASNQRQINDASNAASSKQRDDQSGNTQPTTAVSDAASPADVTPVSRATAVAALMDSVAGMVGAAQASGSATTTAANSITQDTNPSTRSPKDKDKAPEGNNTDALNQQASSSIVMKPDAGTMAAALQNTAFANTHQRANAGATKTAQEQTPSASLVGNDTTVSSASLKAGQTSPLSSADLPGTTAIAPASGKTSNQSASVANNAISRTSATDQSTSTTDLSASSASALSESAALISQRMAPAIANTPGNSTTTHQLGSNTATEGIAALGTSILPQNQINASATPPGTADNGSLRPPVGSQDWNTALGQQVTWMANSQQQSATLTLNPPDLGPVRIVLNLSDTQQLGASFLAAQPETRAALEAAMPRLREMLDGAGIQLGQTSVGSGDTPSNNWNSNNRTPSNAQSAFSGDNDESITDGVTLGALQTNSQSAGIGLIDTHV